MESAVIELFLASSAAARAVEDLPSRWINGQPAINGDQYRVADFLVGEVHRRVTDLELAWKARHKEACDVEAEPFKVGG